MQCRGVLDFVVVLQLVAEDFLGVEGALGRALMLERPEPAAVQQRIAGGDVDPKIEGVAQPRRAGRLERRDEQPETRNRDDVGIQIDAEYLIQGALREHRRRLRRLRLHPQPVQPRKPAEQEVPATARRIDHPHHAKTEGFDGR